MLIITNLMPNLSAGSDYIDNSKVLVFSGNSAQTVSIQIIDDSISEPSETFFGLLSSADGMTIPPNILLEPARATAAIINKNGMTELHHCDILMYNGNFWCRSPKVCRE